MPQKDKKPFSRQFCEESWKFTTDQYPIFWPPEAAATTIATTLHDTTCSELYK
jgi:hypothetical protein